MLANYWRQVVRLYRILTRLRPSPTGIAVVTRRWHIIHGWKVEAGGEGGADSYRPV